MRHAAACAGRISTRRVVPSGGSGVFRGTEPRLNRSSSAPKSLCAARRRHMKPRRVLVVQSRGPLRVAMEHTSGALRSRNSASLAPEPATGRECVPSGFRQSVLFMTTERPRLSWVVPAAGTVQYSHNPSPTPSPTPSPCRAARVRCWEGKVGHGSARGSGRSRLPCLRSQSAVTPRT